MKLSIEYCAVWNYLPKASSLEAELKKSLPTIEISLVPSAGGVFEVVFDEKLIFSKKALNRFPGKGEILNIINNQWFLVYFAN